MDSVIIAAIATIVISVVIIVLKTKTEEKEMTNRYAKIHIAPSNSEAYAKKCEEVGLYWVNEYGSYYSKEFIEHKIKRYSILKEHFEKILNAGAGKKIIENPSTYFKRKMKVTRRAGKGGVKKSL